MIAFVTTRPAAPAVSDPEMAKPTLAKAAKATNAELSASIDKPSQQLALIRW